MKYFILNIIIAIMISYGMPIFYLWAIIYQMNK